MEKYSQNCHGVFPSPLPLLREEQSSEPERRTGSGSSTLCIYSTNNRKLSTVKQKTSNQLYILGMLNLFGSEHRAVKDFFESNIIDFHHNGLEEPDVIDAASEEEAVVVPEAMLHLFNANLQEL